MPLAAVFFDFDFTLAESTTASVECINHALVACGYPAAEREAIRRCIAFPLAEVLPRLTGVEDHAAIAQFAAIYRSRADQVTAGLTQLFPSVYHALPQLRSQSLKTAIVSTKPRYRIESILALREAGHLFDFIVGGEDVRNHKPDPEPLLRAMSRWSLAPQEVVYVGDHPVDAQAARDAEIPFIAMLTGTSRASDFEPFPTHAQLHSLDDLPPILARLSHRL
ncbi:HAD-superfamily hydrolase, subfamily IA, variant 1 [Pirellula staleyi DSM 6068]|uniref:phosphoglycolate phosphatase n=1 Tax=Pirellula staleyi (strain ATCC 27377 / DSM 6068 / ICPB 4128) TaxID=530564 RepID=D2R8C2_PIRSD|nr:HAD family hydrolase [Pirellula staleyi]ADB15739.1 HAD-superfamily hydrolase, subfamily IA, variant 1 [Pirellula staleyi DSM 6068]